MEENQKMVEVGRTETSPPHAGSVVGHQPSPHPLLPAAVQAEYRRRGYWEDLTLADVVQGWARRDPDRVAIVGDESITYAELWDRSRRLAAALAAAGVQTGEFVVAVMSNSWQGVVLAVASSVAGVALSPLSSRTSPTLAMNLFDQVGARALVLQADLLGQEEWRAALATRRDHPIMLQGEAPPVSGYESLPSLEVCASAGPLMEQRDRDPGRPSLVISTGGTTGRPKSVLQCANALIYAARRFAAATDFTEADVHVAFGPYGHASGSVFEVYMPLLHGAAILPIARWQALPVAEAIARWGGTYCITVGTHIFDLLALEPGTEPLLRSLRLVTSGAGPDHLFEDAERRFGFPIVRVFGLSECMGHAIGRPGDTPEVRLHHDGVPFNGVEHRILDPLGEPVPPGTPGEYFCRAPSLFMGYFGQPELTAASVTPDGFYRTGDLMVEDARGYLTWSGRLKDIIRRGGLQIDAVEMENMLAEHPKIAEVVVVGEPDARVGERAVAVVVCRDENDRPGLEDLCRHLMSEGIGKESLPERLVFATSLPRTEFGKFHRVEIRKWLAEQTPTAPVPGS
ncbi:MAG TPA: class I adenylate-forming enzyme family protein [Candidatus Dormibacteraeota bacterium]